ncbi:hypothetical protein FRB93_009555 [Tulasnella sp. JGI-2019a]|nr:hypothetical protein FRB93_009555 [Tulasnella sp. JGI-2019a]
MKSLTNFLSSRKKTKDKQSQPRQTPAQQLQQQLHPRSVSRASSSNTPCPSPVPSSASTSKKGRIFSSSTTQSSGLYGKKNSSTVRLPDSSSMPSHPLSRLFFRSAVDVSRVTPSFESQDHHAIDANANANTRIGVPSVRVTDTSDLGCLSDQQKQKPIHPLQMTSNNMGEERAVGNDSAEVGDPFAAHYQPPPPPSGHTPPTQFISEMSPGPTRRPTSGSRSVSSKQQQQPQSQRPPIRPRSISVGGTKCPSVPPHVLGPLPPVPKFPPIMRSSAPASRPGTTYGPIPHVPSMQITQSAPAEVTSFAASRSRSKSVSSGSASASGSGGTPTPSQSGDMAAYRSMKAQTRHMFIKRQAPSPNPVEPVPRNSMHTSSSVGSEAEMLDSDSDSRPMSMRVPQLDLTWERFLNEAHEDGASLPSWTSATMNVLDATTARITGAPGRPLPPPPPSQNPPVTEPLIVRRRSRAQTLVGGSSPQPSKLLPGYVNTEIATMTPSISLASPTAASGGMPHHRQFPNLNQVVVITPLDHQLKTPDMEAEPVGLSTPDTRIPGTPDTASSLPYLKSVSIASTSTPEAVIKQQKKSSLSSVSLLGWDYSQAGSELSLSLFPKPPSTTGTAGVGLGLPPSQGDKLLMTTVPGGIRDIAPLLPPQIIRELPTPPITPLTCNFLPSMIYPTTGTSQSSTTIRAPPALPLQSADRKSTTPSEAGTLSPSINSEARSSISFLFSTDHRDDLTSSATTVCSQDPDCSTSTFGTRSSSETDRSHHTMIMPQTAQKAWVASGTIWPAATSTPVKAGATPMLAMPSLGSDTFSLLSSLDFGPSLNVPEPPTTPAKTRLVRQLSKHLLTAEEDAFFPGSLPRSPGSPHIGGVEWGQAL